MGGVHLDSTGAIVTCPACGQRNRIGYERLGQTIRCGRCRTEIPAIAVPVDVPSAELFDRLIAASALPVLVDYWAPWCGPCRVVAPELEKVAAAGAGRLLVAKLNTEDVPAVAERAGIFSIPTMAVFWGGREVARDSGARPAADIERFVWGALDRR